MLLTVSLQPRGCHSLQCRRLRGTHISASRLWVPTPGTVSSSRRLLLREHGAREGRSGFWQGIPTPTRLSLREGGEEGRGALPHPELFPTRGLRVGCTWPSEHSPRGRCGCCPLPSCRPGRKSVKLTPVRSPREAPHHDVTRVSRGGRGSRPGEFEH